MKPLFLVALIFTAACTQTASPSGRSAARTSYPLKYDHEAPFVAYRGVYYRSDCARAKLVSPDQAQAFDSEEAAVAAGNKPSSFSDCHGRASLFLSRRPQRGETVCTDQLPDEIYSKGELLDVVGAACYPGRIEVYTPSAIYRIHQLQMRGESGALERAFLWQGALITETEHMAIQDSLRAEREREARRVAAIRERQEKARQDSIRAVEQARQRVLEQQRRAREQRIRAQWPRHANDIIAGRVRIGMTTEMVREALGAPQNIHRTETVYGVSEQWVYRDLYVYLDDGFVTAIQSSR